MEVNFIPDYNNLVAAARNIKAARLPLYEHGIDIPIMETIMNKKFVQLISGNRSEKREFFTCYNEFYRSMGYDTVSFERCIGSIMPGNGSLGGHKPGEIKDRADFDRYPWKEIPDLYFNAFTEDFELLRETMPAGMKAVGGPGNGIFECVEEITGFMGLCYIRNDDEELYNDLFDATGKVIEEIWRRFMERFGDIYCVLRFGDDLGYKISTLLPPEDVKSRILPNYKRVVEIVHQYHKPFLLHSCGSIFDVMDDLIVDVKIDAKHSNEDLIAPFAVWVEKYGSAIGNFGGIDTSALCLLSEADIRTYILDLLRQVDGKGGIAFSSGNSIPYYVPIEGYLAMIQTVRGYRGDFKA